MARHDSTRDPWPSPGALRAGGVAGPDFDGHRRRAGDRGRMAEPAARDELFAGFLRRHPGQGLSSDLIRGSATKAWSATRLSISRLASQQMERRTFSASGNETTEGAKFWLKVMNDLKARGVEDILVAVVDGLRGFPEAIEAVFPQAAVQTCIVHLIRNSLDFVSWKDRKTHRRRTAQNLPRRGRRGRPQGPSGLRGRLMGPQICGDRPDLAAAMGADHPVLRLCSGRAQNHLHHDGADPKP